MTVNGNATYNTANGYTSIASGTYRWTAKYTSSNTNNSDAESGCQAEQVTISPKKPDLTTNATQSATIDSPISDTATLSGATSDAGGKITFNLYGPNDDNCSGTAVYTKEVAVSGNGNYPSGNFTPDAFGTYRWTADYSGDDNNEAKSSPCNAATKRAPSTRRRRTSIPRRSSSLRIRRRSPPVPAEPRRDR